MRKTDTTKLGAIEREVTIGKRPKAGPGEPTTSFVLRFAGSKGPIETISVNFFGPAGKKAAKCINEIISEQVRMGAVLETQPARKAKKAPAN